MLRQRKKKKYVKFIPLYNGVEVDSSVGRNIRIIFLTPNDHLTGKIDSTETVRKAYSIIWLRLMHRPATSSHTMSMYDLWPRVGLKCQERILT